MRILKQIVRVLDLLMSLVFLAYVTRYPLGIVWLTLNQVFILVLILFVFRQVLVWVKKVNPGYKSNRIIQWLYYLGSGGIIIGFLFRILHWPFSSLIQLMSVLLVILAIILRLFKADEDIKTENPDILDDL